jgi:hypothetical protein
MKDYHYSFNKIENGRYWDIYLYFLNFLKKRLLKLFHLLCRIYVCGCDKFRANATGNVEQL